MSRPITIALKNNWKQAWASSLQRNQIIIGLIILFIILSMLPSFFNLIEKRKGITLNDPILAAIPAYNVSWVIFSVIWGMGLLMLIRAVSKPAIFIAYLWTLILVCLVRVISISLVSLNPPVGLIILTDPLTGVFYGESTITKDLFFSGHTSTLVLIFLCLEKRNDKIAGFIAIITVAFLLMIQHVHYTIDIVAAPIIVYPLFRLSKFFLK